MKHIIVIFAIFSSVAFAQTAPELEAILQKRPQAMATRLQLANIYLAEKQFDKVIGLLNPYTDLLTDQGFLALANAYSNKKDYTNEVRVLNLLVNKEDKNYQWHMLLGQGYLKLAASLPQDAEKKKDANTSAIQQFRKTLHLQPKYKPAFNILLVTLLSLKAHNEAREVISEGINKFGDRPELYSELCRLDSNDSFLAQAVKNCKMAIKIAPEFPDNYVYFAQALYDQNEQMQAESEIVAAARRFARSEFVQWAAGTIFFKKKNYAVSQRYFTTALGADPKSSRAQFGLAQCLFETGDEKGAFDHFMKACAADPSTIDTFLAAGGRLKQKGNYQLGDKFVTNASACRNTRPASVP